jgi:hypothetical protein
MALFKKSKPKFPTFAAVLLAIGVIWFLNEIKVIPWANIPWIPVVLIIVAIGMIINRYRE